MSKEMDDKESGIEELERMCTNESSEPIRISYSVIESVTKKFYKVIGCGGFGTVYLGALRDDFLLAVKELSISRDLSDTQFLREVECLKAVNHKNIVRFLGYCADSHGVVMEVEGKVRLVDVRKRFLCFEYAPNGNLHDYLQVSSAKKPHGYEWSICYKIIKGICQGLHYLRQKGIKHMDLKPENVLLGVQMEPKITDFGLSRCNDGSQSIRVQTSELVGTPGYMPPELIKERKVSFKSDIYNLGIIMIRLLTGINEAIPDDWHESLTVDCQQKERCIEIARICYDNDPYKRPTIFEIINKLTEKEITNQNVPPVIIAEPRNDPTFTLNKIVKEFLALHPETLEDYRGRKKLRVEQLEHPKWKLAFQVRPKFPIITGENIRDAHGDPLKVILLDTDTGKPSSALPDVLQIELVPLLGNFPRDSWDANDFQRGVVDDVMDHEEKHPVLDGDYRPTMWDGRATVSELVFTEGSQAYGSMFRIGVRVVPDSYQGARILEGMTEAFMVRDRYGSKLHHSKNYKWQLVFRSQPRRPIYVGCQIRDVIGNPLEIILVDAETGLPSALPVTELQIELVLIRSIDCLHFRLFNHGRVDWSADEFQRAVPRSAYLSGDVSLTMKDDGRVTVNELKFTGSKPPASVFCIIGVRVVPGSYNGPATIREGVTKSFIVEDSPDEDMTMKHFPPKLDDEVWRLKKISWGGVFHRRLEQSSVRNVQDFLTMLEVKPDKLRTILGDDMDDRTWSEVISHARTCDVPGDKLYAYSTAHATIYVNSIFQLAMVELRRLDEAQKIFVQQAMQKAYEHRHSLREVKPTLKLEFTSQPRLPIHAGSRILDAAGNPLEIILVDWETGSPTALLTELEIELVPLLGEFPLFDDWSTEEFYKAIVAERQEDVPLLKCNDDKLIMRDGRITVPEELQFTDDSSWVRGGKFRIGAKVYRSYNYRSSYQYDFSFRIYEAMTDAFVVGDLNRKHYPPVSSDPVWRLEMIDKEGAAHRKLTSNNVYTVQEFVRMLYVKHDELRTIVGDAMTDRMWNMTTSHAEGCDRGDKVYAYSEAKGTIYIDSIFCRLLKIEIDGVECRLDGLNKSKHDNALVDEMMIARQLVLEAYEHRHNLQEIVAAKELHDGFVCYIEFLLSFTEHYMDYDDDDLDDEDYDDLDDEDDDHAQALVHAVAELELN